MSKNPDCYGFYHPIEEECKKNCSFQQSCQKFQESKFEIYYQKYQKEKEIPDGLNLEDIINIDEDIF